MIKNYSCSGLYETTKYTHTQDFNEILNKIYLDEKDLNILFNIFKGKGGEHKLNRWNFNNYYQYSDAKQEYELGQFFTPSLICKLIVDMLEIEKGSIVADICSGKGTFFNYLNSCKLYGVEKELTAYNISKQLFPHANIQNSDMREMEDLPLCDYIVGNPPFNIPFPLRYHPFSINKKVLSQSFYLYKAHEYLKPNGFMGVIFPYFTNPPVKTANNKVINFFWNHFKVLAFVNLPRGIFKESKTNIQTKILILQKKEKRSEEKQINFFKTTFRSYNQVLEEWRSSKQYVNYIKDKP